MISNKVLARILKQLSFPKPIPHYFLQSLVGIRGRRRFADAIHILEKGGYVVVDGEDVRLAEISSAEQFMKNTDMQPSRRTESIRYWITTIIAVAAFIKSFFF